MNVKLAVILYALLSSAWMQICLGEKKKKDADAEEENGAKGNGAKGKVKMSDDFLQELMDEHDFISAIYWSKSDDDPDVLAVEYCVPGEWCDVSVDYTFGKDVGQPGRVWKSKDYEYNENVQNLDPEKFLRQPVAVEVGIKGLLCVAHTKKGKFKGAVELGLKKDDPVDEDVVEAVKAIIQTE